MWRRAAAAGRHPGEGGRAVRVDVFAVVVAKFQESSCRVLVNVFRVRLTQVLVLLRGKNVRFGYRCG